MVINGETQVLAVDNVVICAGQEPNRALAQPLIDSGKTVHLIGGCDVAMELDARRAIAGEHGWRWRFKSCIEVPDATLAASYPADEYYGCASDNKRLVYSFRISFTNGMVSLRCAVIDARSN